MQKVAESTLNLLKKIKKNKISAPKISSSQVVIIITWLFISYLLYPHTTPQGEVKGIADNRVLQTKPTKIVGPTPTLYVYKNTASVNKNLATTLDSQTNIPAFTNSQTALSDISTDSTTTPSSNTSSVQSSPPTSTPINENNPTPTLYPIPTAQISGTQNPVVSLSPTIPPTTNENNTTLSDALGTLVRTIISSAPSH